VNARGAVDEADRVARAGHYTFVSPGPVRPVAPGQSGLLLRDPDGHALLVFE
jgi:hypothetical protein